MPKGQTFSAVASVATAAGGQVVEYVRREIEGGRLKPGDRLAPERDLARQIGVSRPSLRSGLRSLQAMGVIRSRQGSGTFIADGPPRLGEGPLQFLAALHGFTRDEMFEARRVLEVGTAGLAAERADSEQMATMAEEVASMFASLDDPQPFLLHDVQFHRAVAAGSHNAVLATLIDTLAALVYETRRRTVERATDLKESAEMHRRIYRAIKARDAESARREMSEHLDLARQAQAGEEKERTAGAVRPARR
jgi:GntR family transcriptional regulator, transcriptional repressor for pyruvate dehydrogenase complex